MVLTDLGALTLKQRQALKRCLREEEQQEQELSVFCGPER